ncbi:MAG: N-acetylmuramoyl-L-alanine amidase [Streptosporangiaceae bacterium]|nr:N-acetylmuramoyl-L-alanine amidase [Streptosporangiaceae bacterium]MDX6419222.1 N-acetylmuramoyl-L-alanine amidase [Trebonia sp.]
MRSDRLSAGFRSSVVYAAIMATSLGALSACGGGSAKSAGGQVAAASAGAPADTGKQAKPLAGKVIALDPGHNGGNAAHPEIINKPVYIITGYKECDTTGTETDAGYSEHAFNWDVSNRLKTILESRGAKVVLTRHNDTGVGPCINQRAAVGNRAKADAALSVHADGAARSGHGFHIIEPAPIKGHTDKTVKSSNRLALALRAAYLKGTQIPYSTYAGKNALDVRNDLGGLNLSTVPKVFIETGNMQNPGDAAKLSDANFRQRIAQSLADGFSAYFS